MAKVLSPLFSLDASGSIGNLLTYTESKDTKIVKLFHVSPDADTSAQQIQRQKYIDGVEVWNSLDPAMKQIFESLAEGQALTGFNFFMSEYLNGNDPIQVYNLYGTGLYEVGLYL
ncbi:MAG: hypothetical protein V3W20_05620 [Candidatus Neomarinimicrobiota bacterium]